jgi:hypothetical protein
LAKAVFFCHYNPSAKADGNKELSKKLNRQFDTHLCFPQSLELEEQFVILCLNGRVINHIGY